MEKFEIKGKLYGFFNTVLPLVYDDSLSYYEAIQKLVEKINQFLDILNQHSEAIEEFADINGEQYDKFVEEVNKQYSQIQSQIDNVYQQINILKVRADNTDTQIDDLHKHLIEIEQYLQDIPEKMEQIMQDLTEIQNRVTKNEQDITNIISGAITVGKATEAATAGNASSLGGIPADQYALKGEGGGGTPIEIDKELSPTSTNAVENKAIYNGIADAAANLRNAINTLKQQLLDGTVVVKESENSTTLGGYTYEEIKDYIDEKAGEGGSITVDRALSWTSPNPVANFEVSGALIWLDSEIQELRHAIENGGGSGEIIVDDQLSTTSVHPVQNRVITMRLNDILTLLDALEERVDEIAAGGGQVVVDRALNWTSPNPVANFEVSGAIIWLDSQIQEVRLIVENLEPGTGVTVDKALDENSENPIANKAVATAIKQLQADVDQVQADEITFEDVDTTLDNQSSRPVENKAIAEAFDTVHDHVEENHNAFLSAMASLADGTTVVGKAKDSESVGGVKLDSATYIPQIKYEWFDSFTSHDYYGYYQYGKIFGIFLAGIVNKDLPIGDRPLGISPKQYNPKISKYIAYGAINFAYDTSYPLVLQTNGFIGFPNSPYYAATGKGFVAFITGFILEESSESTVSEISITDEINDIVKEGEKV